MTGLLARARLLMAAGFVVLICPLLAGLGGAGSFTIGTFAAIFTGRYMLTTDQRTWANPLALVVGMTVNAAVAGLLWLAGGWLSRRTGWAPQWGALPPILLAVAASALSVQLWSARRDALVNDALRDMDGRSEDRP